MSSGGGGGAGQQGQAADGNRAVDTWKVKKLIKSLQAAKGCVFTDSEGGGLATQDVDVAVRYAYRTLSPATHPPLTRTHSNGTSMISLIIPPRDQISRVNKMLADEVRALCMKPPWPLNKHATPNDPLARPCVTIQYGTATNIKSRTNRLSVLDAITSTQQRLKLYSKVPPNGLVRGGRPTPCLLC